MDQMVPERLFIGVPLTEDARRAIDERRGWAAYLRVHPVVDSLRGEPGFDALIERMKFDAPAGPPPMTPDSAAAYM